MLPPDFFASFMWNYETIDGKNMYTIRDEVECKQFWLRFWKDIMVEKFKKQKMITNLSNVDLSRPVMVLEENRNMINLQPSIQSIAYYADEVTPETYTPPFVLTKINCITVVFIYIIISILCFLSGILLI